MGVAADIKTYMQTAATARVAGNFDSAIANAEAAFALICSMPSSAKHSDEQLDWDGEAISSFIKAIKQSKQEAALTNSGGLRFTRPTFKPPCTTTTTSNCECS